MSLDPTMATIFSNGLHPVIEWELPFRQFRELISLTPASDIVRPTHQHLYSDCTPVFNRPLRCCHEASRDE